MLTAAVAALAFLYAPDAARDVPLEIGVADVDATERFLASPALEGRMTLARGGTKAGDYLAKQFGRIGLDKGPERSFFYEFPVTFGFRPTKNNSLEFTTDAGRKIRLEIGRQYRPLVNSTETPLEAPVVFVGFGLDRDDWNDYAGVDVKGKIALMFRGVPEGRSPTTTGSKAQTAAAKGAVGIVVVGPNVAGRAELPNYTRAQGMAPDTGIAGAGVRSELFRDLTGMDYATARAMKRPASKALPLKARLQAKLEPNSGIARDVVGYLPGHDPALKDQYIVVGAHYDHLGYGEVASMSGTDAIHPGADDNASGSSGVVAIARYFARKKSNRRTMIFQLYEGEELGLLGSEAWAKGHADILKHTSAMLNMDMIGRLRQNRLEIYGTGTAKEWTDILATVDARDLKPQPSPNSRGDSDQASFARRNVPVLFFFTGMHPEYHSEKDTLDTVNIPGIAAVAGFVARVAEAVDALPAQLAFVGSGQGTQTQNDAAHSQGRRIRVGFVPDMSDAGKGVLLEGVSPGSPAEKAGFRAGDRIVEFNGHKLDGLEALAEAMIGPNPGDKVKVVFERNGKRLEVVVTVEASNR